MISSCLEECAGYIETQAPTMCYVIDGVVGVILIGLVFFFVWQLIK